MFEKGEWAMQPMAMRPERLPGTLKAYTGVDAALRKTDPILYKTGADAGLSEIEQMRLDSSFKLDDANIRQQGSRYLPKPLTKSFVVRAIVPPGLRTEEGIDGIHWPQDITPQASISNLGLPPGVRPHTSPGIGWHAEVTLPNRNEPENERDVRHKDDDEKDEEGKETTEVQG